MILFRISSDIIHNKFPHELHILHFMLFACITSNMYVPIVCIIGCETATWILSENDNDEMAEPRFKTFEEKRN